MVIPARMNPVGQKDNDNRTIQVHPEGGAGETQVPDAVRRKITAAGRSVRSRPVKPQGAAGSFPILQKLPEQVFFEHTGGRVAGYRAEDFHEQAMNGGSGAEQPGLTVHAAGDIGILIMDDALPVPEQRQVLGWPVEIRSLVKTKVPQVSSHP